MRISNALIVAGLLSVVSAQVEARSLLPLEAGTYVREGVDVVDAPFAALVAYDGSAFSGPHSSACRSKLLSHRGATYRLSTTCEALGDGTPAVATTEVERVVVVSPTRMRFARGDDVALYRLAPRS